MTTIPKYLVAIAVVGTLAGAQSQVIRNTTPPSPPNPLGYLLDPTGGPMAGEVWTPSVDETVFPLPGVAPLFFIGISESPGPLEIPFSSDFILIDVLPPSPIATVGPVVGGGGLTPIAIPIPAQCDLIGLSLSTQAAMIGGTPAIQLANAIDIIIGGGPPGLYSLAADQPVLFKLDPTTGATLSSVTINLPGIAFDWGNAMAKHPLTGELYAVLRVTGGPAPAGPPHAFPQTEQEPLFDDETNGAYAE